MRPGEPYRVERLSDAEWRAALLAAPTFSFFVSPAYVHTWMAHHAPAARALALHVAPKAGSARRLVVLVQSKISRLGTSTLVGAPEGGYATAGVGEMPPDGPQFAIQRLYRPWTGAVELTLEPGTSAAAPLPSLRQRRCRPG